MMRRTAPGERTSHGVPTARRCLALLLPMALQLPQGTPSDGPVAGSFEHDFTFTCRVGPLVVFRVGPERHDAHRVARNITVRTLEDGRVEWRFQRGRVHADTAEVIVAGANVMCEAAPGEAQSGRRQTELRTACQTVGHPDTTEGEQSDEARCDRQVGETQTG